MESLRTELRSARGGEATLKAEVSRLQSVLAAAKADLEEETAKAKTAENAAQEALKCRVTAEGAIFRTVAERVIFAESLSSVAGKLASIAGGKIAGRIFERLQLVVLELNWPILGYMPLPEKSFQQGYVKILLDALDSSEVLRTLGTQTELLSVEQINELPTDRDTDLEPILRLPKAGDEFSSADEERGDEEEDEEEEAQGEEGQTTTADVNSPPPTNEGPHQGGEVRSPPL